MTPDSQPLTATVDQLHRKAQRLVRGQLADDETVVTVFPGRSRQAMVVTDRRLLVVKPGLLTGIWLGRKAASFTLEEISAINVHTGRGIAALELVLTGEQRRVKADLASAFQRPNWLPCTPSLAQSPLIGELRAYVRSDGRALSARSELSGSQS